MGVTQYTHDDKQRANNPPVGLVTPRTDPQQDDVQTYAHDPHIDPQLHWAGKAEHTSFQVPTVSLHVHERIDPRTIVEAVRKRNGGGDGGQRGLFAEEREVPLRHAIEFYKHAHHWSNRLIAGDSLLVMNSLLTKENMAGKVQCVYMDPPYGIKYGSNFQPFVGKRDVKDGKGEDLTAEPEMIKAFRDTWELGIHSYLSYMRDRLLLAKELLAESGSCFVQISDENVHHVREIMDEIFGAENFVSLISFRKTSATVANTLPRIDDHLVFYAKSKANVKYRQLFLQKIPGGAGAVWYDHAYSSDGLRRVKRNENLKSNETYASITALFVAGNNPKHTKKFVFNGQTFMPGKGRQWKVDVARLKFLESKNRLAIHGSTLKFIRLISDKPIVELSNVWQDTWAAGNTGDKNYVVQTSNKVLERCILMTTDPGDLVLDPTCGSGTTAFVAEQWGRRWITCDTSRVATTLAKQRIMTASFDYYKLAKPDDGVGSGFEYKKVPHITLKSIANNQPPATETLYDQPHKDTKRARVTGPFTVEAVPSPSVQPIAPLTNPAPPMPADASIARSGETLRQSEWRDELLHTGIRGKGGQRIAFARIDPLSCRYLHADAETKPDDAGSDEIREAATAYRPRRAVISFGPEHAPLDKKQVEHALGEAARLMPKPEIIVFAAFQFDAEAAKDIDETNWPGITLLQVQMNADLQTSDLKRNRASNESFWLIGQPDISLRHIRKGDHTGKWQVEVHGFDYFNTRNGELESGGENRIAMWMLDTDYDGRSLYPTQVFFPMSDAKSGWTKLAKNLKAEIDEGLIEMYRGTQSLPFAVGGNERIAVKIVDDRGVESLRVMEIRPMGGGNDKRKQ